MKSCLQPPASATPFTFGYGGKRRFRLTKHDHKTARLNDFFARMVGPSVKKHPVGVFSEGASLQGGPSVKKQPGRLF